MTKIEDFSLILLAIVPPFLAMLAGHWFPWRYVFGRNLRPLEAYAYGVSWIVAAPLMVMFAQDAWLYLLLLLGGVAGAGAGTMIAYAVDRAAKTHHEMMDAKDENAHAARWGFDQDVTGD